MDWEDLLHSLRDLLAQRGSTESEKHVLDLLKERTTDNELYSHGQTLDDWQLDQAKIVACDILRDHPDLLDIIRNLELKRALLPKSTIETPFPPALSDGYTRGLLIGRPRAFSLFMAQT